MQSSPRNSGQSLVEFVILFPVIIYFTLILIQTAFIYNAYQIVNYAAYCSARAGIVYKANMDKMKRAAVIATIPIAGRKISTGVFFLPRLPQIPHIDDYYHSASLKTGVKLQEYTDSELTVTVTHHFQLIVPGVGVLFGAPHLPVRATCTLPI